MGMKYAFNEFDKESMARARGSNLTISLKKSVEICKAIQGKKVGYVKKYLQNVIDGKEVVPYTRYNQEMPHKKGKGIAAGGYPKNVAKEFLKLVSTAEKNAENNEINGTLYVISASARQGTSRYKMGRFLGRQRKSTHAEVIVGVRK